MDMYSNTINYMSISPYFKEEYVFTYFHLPKSGNCGALKCIYGRKLQLLKPSIGNY